MSQLKTQMRKVLLDLAMLGAGRTTSYNPSGGGEPDHTLVDDRGRGLKRGDAPHLEHAARWNAAGDDAQRAAVLEAALAELDQLRRSHADPNAGESKKDRDRRIVREGEGWPVREVATTFRTGIRDVRNVRRDAGRDLENGLPLANGHALSPDERRAAILRLHRQGLSPHRIALTLGLPRSTIRYVVARAGPRSS